MSLSHVVNIMYRSIAYSYICIYMSYSNYLLSNYGVKHCTVRCSKLCDTPAAGGTRSRVTLFWDRHREGGIRGEDTWGQEPKPHRHGYCMWLGQFTLSMSFFCCSVFFWDTESRETKNIKESWGHTTTFVQTFVSLSAAGPCPSHG